MFAVSSLEAPDVAVLLTWLPTRQESLSSWREVFAGLFDIGEAPEADPAPANMAGAIWARADGGFVLSGARTGPIRLIRSIDTIRRSKAEGFAVRLALSGGISGRVGDKTLDCSVGDVVFIDLLQTLDIQTEIGADGGEASDIVLWIPRQKMLALVSDESALHGLIAPGASPAGQMIGANLRLLGQLAGQASSREFEALIAGLVQLIVKAIAPLRGATRGTSLTSLVTIRRYIEQNLQSPGLSADGLAKTFGLSRASLYRLFEPVGGIAGQIRKARLNRAYQEIVAMDLANQRIAPIAYRQGFKNLSAFNRLFKATYGLSPGEARAQALAASDVASAPSEAGPASIERLLAAFPVSG